MGVAIGQRIFERIEEIRIPEPVRLSTRPEKQVLQKSVVQTTVCHIARHAGKPVENPEHVGAQPQGQKQQHRPAFSQGSRLTSHVALAALCRSLHQFQPPDAPPRAGRLPVLEGAQQSTVLGLSAPAG